MYTIGELSQHTQVHRETIRYYEKLGLLPEPQRAPNGYRLYNDADLERLNFIRRARALDFTINDITEILAFRDRNEPPCQHVLALMEAQLHLVQERIRDLERLRDELTTLYVAGKQLPEDVQMRACVCHLIRDGISEEG